MVVLKRLEDAVAEHDEIWAVIKSSAINNDGATKIGYMAPSEVGQSEVISMALEFSEIDAATISYVEAHGTGTELGDPIELNGLSNAFRKYTDKNNFCAIGSVKGNIGHCDVAAGVAGIIKTALALKFKKIPPSINFTEANPGLEIESSPFYVNTVLCDWEKSEFPRRAAISSFGIGGTNAHCILEEWESGKSIASDKELHLLPLSSKSLASLEVMTENLIEHLKSGTQEIGDIAYTLQTGRNSYNFKTLLLGRNIKEIINNFDSLGTQGLVKGVQKMSDPTTIFMFTGQGSQYVNMAKGLYESFSIYRNIVDSAHKILSSDFNINLKELLFHDSLDKDHQKVVNLTSNTQPLLFTVQYATACLLMDAGIFPDALIGHSIGEVTAATVSGVFTFEEALKFVAIRGDIMQKQKSGSMLSVSLSPKDLNPYLNGANVELALHNAPGYSVVSGSDKDINDFNELLKKADGNIHTTILKTSHAFHSKLMEPALEPFLEAVGDIHLSKPNIPLISNVTGTWMEEDEACSHKYWVDHIRSTVRFSDGITEIFQSEDEVVFVEVGPGNSLSMLLSQFPKTKNFKAISTIRHPHINTEDIITFYNAISEFWISGGRINWDEIYEDEIRLKVPLPTYPFKKERHWLNPKANYKSFSAPDQTGTLSISTINDGNEKELNNDVILHNRPEISSQYVAPSNSTEELLKNIWQELLGIKDVGVDDDFFELGGHSLLAAQGMYLIEKQIGNKLPLASLIENPTISKLAAYMDIKFISWDSLVPLKPNGNKVPLFVVHGANHNILIYKNLAENLNEDQAVYALQTKGLSGEVEPLKSVEEMASHYISEIKTINPEGPYALGGFSFGGIIAFEMAKQLKAEGKKVKILALFDSYVYPHLYYTNQLVKKIVLTLYNISQLIFMGFNMFSSVKNFKRRYDLLKLKFSGLGLRLKYGKEKQYQMQFNRSSKIDEMHGLAFSRYNLIPQDIKVDLFRSTEDVFFAHDYNYLGWKKIALGGIRKHIIPGNHSEMFIPPGVNKLSGILQDLLDKSE